jgi:3-deoxy-D-manno-octulosonic-acid transferase
MIRLLYSTALHVLSPFQFLKLWRRGRKLPAYRQRWGERLALFPPLEGQPRIWLHAVSVGETIAAAPLVRQILQDYPNHRLLVTSTTPTGSAQVQRLFGNSVEHIYFPYDLPGTIRRFLHKTRPALLVVMETELWPNCFHHCRQQDIPVIIANARLSLHSFDGYRKFLRLVTPTLQNTHRIAAQTPTDRDRFICLGADAERVINCGNIKFDIQDDEQAAKAGAELREAIGKHRPVWIAASTHEGEEEIILEAHQQLLEKHADALLILVPRHPERFDIVGDLCRKNQLSTRRRSLNELPGNDTAVYLGDTMGELMKLYAAADIAFIGGSFNQTGGHNPLEPASLALPVLTGPTIHNFTDIFKTLEIAGSAEIIEQRDILSKRLTALFDNDKTKTQMGKRGREVIEAHRGATARIMALVREAL